MWEYQSWHFWRRVYYVLIGMGFLILITTVGYDVYSSRSSLLMTARAAAALLLLYLLAVMGAHYYIERRVFQPLATIGEALDRGREVVPPPGALRPVERLAHMIRHYQQSIQESIDRLRRTMEENRLTLQAVQEAYVRLDAQGRIQDVNPSFESPFRRPREALIGTPLESLFGEDSRFFIQHRIPLWAREPEVIEQPLEIRTGHVLHLLFSASPLTVEGRTTGIVLSLDNRRFLEAFIHLARHFNIGLIAEHVQYPEDLEILRDMGIPLGQGVLLGPPMPYDQWDITRAAMHRVTT